MHESTFRILLSSLFMFAALAVGAAFAWQHTSLEISTRVHRIAAD
jgi:hypothetical protein